MTAPLPAAAASGVTAPVPAALFLSRGGRALSDAEEDRFFGSLKTSNDTWKLTASRRFERLDQLVLQALPPPPGSAVSVLDVGASSGVTTLELHRLLAGSGYRPATIATDRSVSAFVVPIARRCQAIVGQGGEILQYVLGRWLVRPWSSRTDRVLGVALLRKALFWAVGDTVRRTLAEAPEQCAKVRLVSARFSAEPGLDLVEDDVLVRRPAFEGRFDLVRAANILNRSYFSEDELRGAIANLLAYLRRPDGLLLLVRTHKDGVQHGTLFALRRNGVLRALRRVGGGSEIERLAIDVSRRRAARAACESHVP